MKAEESVTPESSKRYPPELDQLHKQHELSRAEPERLGVFAHLRPYVRRRWLQILFLAAEASWKRWLLEGLIALSAAVVYLFNPVEEAPEYGLVHEFAIESAEFLPYIAGATDTPFQPDNKIEIYNDGNEFYPPMPAASEPPISTTGLLHSTTKTMFAFTTANSPRSGRKFSTVICPVADR